MKEKSRVSRAMRVLPLLVAGLLVAASTVSTVSPASAQPVAPSHVSVVPTTSPVVAPTAVGPKTAKLTSKCGKKLRWVSVVTAHDAYLRFHGWLYDTKAGNTLVCFKAYKQKAKDKTKISAKIHVSNGKNSSVSTTKSSYSKLIKIPKKKYADVTPFYGKYNYPVFTFYGLS